METWYFSPFPPEFADCDRLFVCEYDLQFFTRKEQMQRHLKKVEMLHPPGDEIYRKEHGPGLHLCYFEVDGRKEKQYCQNLCYLAKLFLARAGPPSFARIRARISARIRLINLSLSCCPHSIHIVVSSCPHASRIMPSRLMPCRFFYAFMSCRFMS